MSQGGFDLTNYSDEDGRTELFDPIIGDDGRIFEDEFSKMIRESGIEMLDKPKSDKFSNSPKGVESITKLSETVKTKVPLRFRSVETPKVKKNTKVDSLTGLKLNLSSNRLLDNLNVLKQENEKNRVGAKWFGKSNFEKDITKPLNRFLEMASANIQEKQQMPSTVFKVYFLPLHERITEEINEQKENEKSATKKKDAESHRLKRECAEKLHDVLKEGFRLWRNMEEEIAKDMIVSLDESGHLDYIRSLANDPNKFNQEKENLIKLVSQIHPTQLARLFKAVIDPESGIESPEFAGMIMNKMSTKVGPAEILNYLKPYPEVLKKVLVATFKVRLEKENDKYTFLRDSSPSMQSLTLLAEEGMLKDFRNDSMNSLNDAVIELAKFKIDAQEQIDERTLNAYSTFMNKVIDSISVEKLPDLLLRHCEDIHWAQLNNLKADPKEASYSLVTFLVLRMYSPMIVSEFPKRFAKLLQQAKGQNEQIELTNQKENFESHATLVTRLLQLAANRKTIQEPRLLVFAPLLEHMTQRFEALAVEILNRIRGEELEELQELPDDEELQEIEDEEPLFEIVEHDGKEFVIGAITTSNPSLWNDHDAFGKRFCISTAKPKVGGTWVQGNQFCALMALQWLDKRPQSLKLGDLSQEAQVEMANRLVDLTMEAQVNLAKRQLNSVSTNALDENVISRKGALIWMATNSHVMAAEVLGNGMAKFYDPDLGTVETIATEELELRTSNCNTFVAS